MTYDTVVGSLNHWTIASIVVKLRQWANIMILKYMNSEQMEEWTETKTEYVKCNAKCTLEEWMNLVTISAFLRIILASKPLLERIERWGGEKILLGVIPTQYVFVNFENVQLNIVI